MKKGLLAGVCSLLIMTAQAQSIDINKPNTNLSQVLEEGFTSWAINTGTSDRITVGTVTVTIANGEGSASNALYANAWKEGYQKYDKLVADGVTALVLDAAGERHDVTEGMVAIDLTVSGLSAGHHSLRAYHNNADGGTIVSPTIGVAVNGETVLTGVKQTQRAEKRSEAGVSYVEFDVEEGQDVTVRYFTLPETNKTYTTTTLYINSLEFDANPFAIVDPQPAHNDLHAGDDGGVVTLSWRGAEVAASHRLYWGTDAEQVENATEPQYAGTDTSVQLTGLSPLVRYYWRVDEVEQYGATHKGQVMCFQPRRLAFPEAEGYGRFAIGGRGGVVYHVTSLDDDSANPQPGTFRYGITQVSGPRTIVFDVGGVIRLKSRLTCSDRFVTIAGQTAPGRGIMLTGAPFGMATDGITRFIRMRVGGGDEWDGVTPNPRTSDGLGMAGNDHAIMDHCSVSWTIDEAFSSRNAKNVTLQRTLISEALNRAGHKNYVESKGPDCEHGYAATIGGDCGSYHHNLLAHCEGRNWSLSGGLDGGGAYAGSHDVFNNVVYNWGSRATDGGTHHGQFVSNYYKMGPSTTKTVLLQADLEGTGTGTQEYYVKGNIRENLNGTKTQDALNDTYNYKLSGGQQLNWTVFVSEPYFESYAKVQTAEMAYRSVLSDVGCNQPALDNHDERMISETLNKTTSTVGSRSGKKGLIDKESDAEGFDGLNIIEARRDDAWDSDQDGMPDWYEQISGSDPLSADNNEAEGDYTRLEVYLNRMALPHFVSSTGQYTVNLNDYFKGFANPKFTAPEPMRDGSTWTIDEQGMLTVSIQLRQMLELEVKANGLLSRTFWFFKPKDDGSGICELPANRQQPAACYDLQGRRLNQPQRGLNIVNGKKIIKTTTDMR